MKDLNEFGVLDIDQKDLCATNGGFVITLTAICIVGAVGLTAAYLSTKLL